MNKALLGALFLLMVSPMVRAADVDPMAHNLIYIDGQAEVVVPIDRFELTFSFDRNRGSFDEASTTSNNIIEQAVQNLKKTGAKDIEVIKGWDLIRQAGISLGSKGRNISNKVILRVNNVPSGQLQTLIAKSIDMLVATDASIILEKVDVAVNEDIQAKMKQQATLKALADLKAKAESMAQALGRPLGAPKRIFIEDNPSPYAAQEMMYDAAATAAPRSLVTFQKSFKVDSEVADHIRINVRVNGVYEIQ